MRRAIVGLTVVGLAVFASEELGAGQAGKPAIKACSLLTKELVMKVSGAANKAVFDLPPSEETVGASGSACEYADVRLQIDAYTPQRIEELRKTTGKDWVPVSGVGDRGYFHNNRDRFAELIVTSGTHTVMIQIGVPFQGTAEQMKPNTITLANAIIPKLK